MDEVDGHRLAALVAAKRGRKGLRATADEIGGVSASTLSRVEQGKVPDLDTFVRLCRWLDVSPNDLIDDVPEDESENDGPQVEVIAAHLRADRTLDKDTSRALEKMIRLAYKAASQGQLQAGK